MVRIKHLRNTKREAGRGLVIENLPGVDLLLVLVLLPVKKRRKKRWEEKR